MFNFKTVKEAMLEKTSVLTLAMIHSILHHFGIGQITTIAELSSISFKIQNFVFIKFLKFPVTLKKS